jgi:arylsulfatase A-like enzyme
VARGIDIAPTLLTIAGAAIPAEMQGRVLDLRRPDAGGIVAAYAEEDFEGNVVEAVRGTRWKLIHANAGNPRGQPERQLFDLVADPGEQRNRYEPGSPEVAELTARLEELETEADRLARATEQRDIDGATEQRLKALGYVD